MLYKNIAISIKDDILDGVYQENEKLPSEVKLAEKYDTTKMTMRKALNLLVNNGFIYAIAKKGYYVSTTQDIKSFNNLNAGSLRKLNKDAVITTRVIEFKETVARAFLAKKFNIDEDDPIFFVQRIRYVDDNPYAIENIYMPKYLFEDFSIEVAKNSIYQYIRSNGYDLSSNRKNISAAIVPIQFSNIDPKLTGKPVLQIENTGLLSSGVVFEYSLTYQLNQEVSVVTNWDELI